MKKVSMLMCAFMVTSALAVPVFAAETSTPAPAAVTSTDSVKKPDKIKPTKVTVKALKEKFAGVMAELKQLKTDNEAIQAKDKAVNQEIKSKKDSLKTSLKNMTKTDRKAYVANLQAQISPVRASIKSLNDDITALRDQRKAQVANLKDAYKAKDETKISAVLNSIVDLQKQINNKLNQVMELKTKISALLK